MFPKKKMTDTTTENTFYGFAFSRQPLTTCSNRALACAMKGLFIFAAIFGTIGGVISSFDLPCNLPLIALLFLFFSLLLAFLHYNRLVFNLCYPVIFILFTYYIFLYRFQVYSGFQAFLAIWQEKYSSYYNLSILREAHEYFSDRTMTITFAAVFIGFFLAVLLNIAISEYMNLPVVIFLTFPIFQMGIFIEEMPDFIYLVLLLFVYFMVGILKRSGHFLLPYREKQKTEFAYRAKTHLHSWRYHASGRIFLQLTVLFFAFSLLLGIVCLPLLSTAGSSSASGLRKQADEYMKIFTQSGLAGFFNRYEATGGISGGQLGGVSSVRPDYEADLSVTFVPYSDEPLYLKAYVGQEYTSSRWNPFSESMTAHLWTTLGKDYTAYEEYTAFLESRRLAHYMEKNPGIYGKMEIKNVGADPNYIYYPYYSTEDFSIPYTVMDGLLCGLTEEESSYTLNYYPLLKNYWNIHPQPDELIADMPATSPLIRYIQLYDAVSTSYYLQVPDTICDELQSYTEEIGRGATVDEQIALIQQYLDENYSYSMAPGTTPRNEDFVLHFLQEQKRGYCAHFATAATLLLRSYGIPARYVEGYALSFTDIADGEAVDASYEEWFTGENPMKESGVVSVDATDANAHAWVEVYKAGIGWVPYEFTPADDSSEDDSGEAYRNFWSLFSGLFRGDQPETVDNSDFQHDNAGTFWQKALENSSFLATPLLLFVGILLVLVLCFTAGKALVEWLRINHAYRKGHYELLLAFYYRKLCTKLKKKGLILGDFLLPTRLPAISLPDTMPYTMAEKEMYMDLLEKCCYSQHSITKKEASEVLAFLKKMNKFIYRCPSGDTGSHDSQSLL